MTDHQPNTGLCRESRMRTCDTSTRRSGSAPPNSCSNEDRSCEDTELLFTEILLEPVLPYDATIDLSDVIDELNIDAQSRHRSSGRRCSVNTPRPGDPYRLRTHQAEALQQSLQQGLAEGRNVVVTSGTGSGKTESFLLPVLTRIVAESLDWPADAPIHRWWEQPRVEWRSGRYLSVRPAAVRAMVLYPTNALVEDQVTRLRRAIRSIATASWSTALVRAIHGLNPGTGPASVRP